MTYIVCEIKPREREVSEDKVVEETSVVSWLTYCITSWLAACSGFIYSRSTFQRSSCDPSINNDDVTTAHAHYVIVGLAAAIVQNCKMTDETTATAFWRGLLKKWRFLKWLSKCVTYFLVVWLSLSRSLSLSLSLSHSLSLSLPVSLHIIYCYVHDKVALDF